MIHLSESLEIGSIKAVTGARAVFVDGQEIEVTDREFALLEYLMRHAGQVISREDLNREVWGNTVKESSNTIDVSVCHLRTKIGDDSRRIIRSIRGIGYFYAQR